MKRFIPHEKNNKRGPIISFFFCESYYYCLIIMQECSLCTLHGNAWLLAHAIEQLNIFYFLLAHPIKKKFVHT